MAPSKGEDEDKVFRPLKEEWLKEHKYTQLMGKIRDWVNAFVGKMNEKDEEQTAEVGCEGMKEGGTEQMTEDEVGVCNFVLKNLLKIKKTNKGKKQRKKVDIEMEEGFIDNVFGILRELGTTLSGGVQHKQCDYNYVLEHMKVLGQPMLQHIWSAIESKREVMTLINANPTGKEKCPPQGTEGPRQPQLQSATGPSTEGKDHQQHAQDGARGPRRARSAENPANSATSRGPEDGEGDIIVRIDANPGISVKYAPSNGQRTNEEAVVLHFGPGGLSTDREDNLIPGSTTIKGPQNPLSTLLKTTVSKTNKKKANYKCPNRKSVEGGYYADENDDGKELSITGWFTRFSEDVTQEDDKKNNREVDTVLYLCEDLDGIPIDDMEKYKGFCRIMVKNIILTTGVPKQYKNEDGEMPCEKKVKNIPVCDLLKVWMYYMRIFCAPKDVIEKILDAVKPVMEKLIYGDGNYAECSYDDALKIPYTGQKNVVDEVYELFDTNILYNKMKETTSKKTWCTKAREGVSPALSDLVEDNRVVAGNGDTKKFNEIVQQVDNILVHEEEEEEKEKKLDVLKENINEVLPKFQPQTQPPPPPPEPARPAAPGGQLHPKPSADAETHESHSSSSEPTLQRSETRSGGEVTLQSVSSENEAPGPQTEAGQSLGAASSAVAAEDSKLFTIIPPAAIGATAVAAIGLPAVAFFLYKYTSLFSRKRNSSERGERWKRSIERNFDMETDDDDSMEYSSTEYSTTDLTGGSTFDSTLDDSTTDSTYDSASEYTGTDSIYDSSTDKFTLYSRTADGTSTITNVSTIYGERPRSSPPFTTTTRRGRARRGANMPSRPNRRERNNISYYRM